MGPRGPARRGSAAPRGWAARERAPPPQPRRAHQPLKDGQLQLRRQERGCVRGRHDRLGAARVRAQGALAQLQVPPPARAALLRGPMPQLPGRGGRLAGRPRLHRAGEGGHAREAHERHPLAGLRRDAGHRHLRHPLHPSGLLLQDLHSAAAAVAAVREGAPQRGGSGKGRAHPRASQVAHRVPPPPRRRAGDRRRPGGVERGPARRRDGGRRGLGRRRPRAGRHPARDGRGRVRPGAGRTSAGGRSRGAGAGGGARVLRRHRPGLAGQHPAPGPRRAPHRGDRVDRAAADVRRQRPSGSDAELWRAAAREPLWRAPRQRCGGRHRRRPGARGRACPARGGRCDQGGRRRAPGRRRARSWRRASSGRASPT